MIFTLDHVDAGEFRKTTRLIAWPTTAAVHAGTRLPFESIDWARRMIRRKSIFHPVNLGPRVRKKAVAGFLINWRHIPVANGTALSLLAHWSGMPEEC